MAFYSDINLQNKMSINFSDYAETIIAEDMETFGISSFSGFVNEVFKNFHDEAKSSENLYLENKQQELTGFKNLLIGSTKLKKEDISAVIYVMLEEEHTKIINMIMDLKAKYGQRNRIIYISKENEKYLFETCEEDEDSIVYSKPGQYFKCVIEEYVMLPFRERERIFKKEVFDILENACNEKKQLRITIPINGNMTKFYVYPYKIMTDVLGTRSYLACYTCKSSEEKKIASFAIHRLKADNIKTGSKNVHLTKKEISSLESEIK